MAVYAVGEGWFGALGTGRLDDHVLGHDDEEPHDGETLPPALKIYDGPVDRVSLGWGHTAILTPPTTSQPRQLLLTGRPHDFSSLLRLRRLPKLLRNYSVRKALESTQRQDEYSLQPGALVGRIVTFLSEQFADNVQQDWDKARQQSVMADFQTIPLDFEPTSVHCGAGLTALTATDGSLYMFGLNGFGQCGVGHPSNNVWEPTAVTGLTTDFATIPRQDMPQSHPVISAALGLQHALCCNEEGEVFAWGKGERGQLGQEIEMGESHTALPIRKAFSVHDEVLMKPVYQDLGKIVQISAGMLHSAALNAQNQVFVWGKHTLPTLAEDVRAQKIASDARLPYKLSGLPDDKQVLRVSCGSHHTAVLLEDGSVYAVGISSDTNEPLHEPQQIVVPGAVELPVMFFDAHWDRTTLIGADGRSVYQVHLWKDPELQEYALFTPAWVDQLLEDVPATAKITAIHRSWKHSVAVTDE